MYTHQYVVRSAAIRTNTYIYVHTLDGYVSARRRSVTYHVITDYKGSAKGQRRFDTYRRWVITGNSGCSTDIFLYKWSNQIVLNMFKPYLNVNVSLVFFWDMTEKKTWSGCPTWITIISDYVFKQYVFNERTSTLNRESKPGGWDSKGVSWWGLRREGLIDNRMCYAYLYEQ